MKNNFDKKRKKKRKSLNVSSLPPKGTKGILGKMAHSRFGEEVVQGDTEPSIFIKKAKTYSENDEDTARGPRS